MRNGLYGSPIEARIFWSNLNPDPAFYQDTYHSGKGETIRVVSVPISSTIKQFAVYETDQSAFLMSQTANFLNLNLFIVPGPSVADRPIRKFMLRGLRTIEFTVEKLLLLTDANKAFFYSGDFLGEIDLTGYPFSDENSEPPQAKVYRFQGFKQDFGPNPDRSIRNELIQVQPAFDGAQF